MPWEWKSMEVKFVLGKAIIFEKRIFAYGASYHLENGRPFHYSPMCFSPSRSWNKLGGFHPIFLQIPSFSMAGKPIFGVVQWMGE